LLLLGASSIFAQTQTNKYEWKVILMVVYQDGNVVAGANANVGYFANSMPESINGVTDINGTFTAEHSVKGGSAAYDLGIRVEKLGYYPTAKECVLSPQYDPNQWTQTLTLILKKVKSPIGMYAKSVNLGMPVFDKPAGFDLLVGDWTTPYGKGVT